MRSGEKLSMRKNRPVRQGAERSGSGEQSGQLCVFGGAAPGLFHRVLGGVLIHLGVQDLIQIQAAHIGHQDEMESTQMKPAELLEQVNKAIAAVLVGGQSYKIGSRSLTRADLSMLKAMRDDLEAQVAAGTPSHLLDRTFVAYFDGR